MAAPPQLAKHLGIVQVQCRKIGRFAHCDSVVPTRSSDRVPAATAELVRKLVHSVRRLPALAQFRLLRWVVLQRSPQRHRRDLKDRRSAGTIPMAQFQDMLNVKSLHFL